VPRSGRRRWIRFSEAPAKHVCQPVRRAGGEVEEQRRLDELDLHHDRPPVVAVDEVHARVRGGADARVDGAQRTLGDRLLVGARDSRRG
jgi:hypothetical protein